MAKVQRARIIGVSEPIESARRVEEKFTTALIPLKS
jgi:hypothetical protein